LRTRAPGKSLVQDESRAILGVVAERDNKEISIRGRRATILGIGRLRVQMTRRQYSTHFTVTPRYFYGTDSNTGDGLLMAMAAGADLWHMNWSSATLRLPLQELPGWHDPRRHRQTKLSGGGSIREALFQ